MWILLFMLIAMGLGLLLLQAVFRERVAERSASAVPRRPAARPPPPLQGTAPALDALPWDDAAPSRPALGAEALRARMRDRYIAARFPGLVASASDLERIDHVIRCARLFFEEERYERAHELLHLAIRQSPQDEPLRLAQLEIAFLERGKDRFIALATRFRAELPDSRNWTEVMRLGRAVAPDETLFAAGPGVRPHEHYGPWPNLPNWIQASWDLTAEVLAADFHRAMLRGPATRATRPLVKRALTGA